jgi:lysozyme family protein
MSDAVATAILSFAVLEGNDEAITLLQRAIVMCGVPVTVDGGMGPETLAAENACDPQKLLAATVQLQKEHFAQIGLITGSFCGWGESDQTLPRWRGGASARLSHPFTYSSCDGSMTAETRARPEPIEWVRETSQHAVGSRT